MLANEIYLCWVHKRYVLAVIHTGYSNCSSSAQTYRQTDRLRRPTGPATRHGRSANTHTDEVSATAIAVSTAVYRSTTVFYTVFHRLSVTITGSLTFAVVVRQRLGALFMRWFQHCDLISIRLQFYSATTIRRPTVNRALINHLSV